MADAEVLVSHTPLSSLGHDSSPTPGSVGRPTPPQSQSRSQSGKRVIMSSQASTISARPSTGCTVLADASGSPVAEYLRPLINQANRHWKQNQENKMMEEIIRLRLNKKESKREMKAKAQEIARKIPLEILGRDWLNLKRESLETRAYLVDTVLPSVVLGVEKLLMEVDARGLALTDAPDPNFNPLNYLAQYLLRNNPKYSNFNEASPYMRSVRQVGHQLRAEILNYDDNRLARLKAEARRRREEYESAEKHRLQERERRSKLLSAQFLEWGVGPTGKIEIALLVTALRSFGEITERFPEELRVKAQIHLPELHPEEANNLLNSLQFSEFILDSSDGLSCEIFDQLVEHLTRCAMSYMGAEGADYRRITLIELFNQVDRAHIGTLDRHRILALFESFYDEAGSAYHKSLRNPRKWPVVELDEEISDDEEEEEEEEEDEVDDTGDKKSDNETVTKAETDLVTKAETDDTKAETDDVTKSEGDDVTKSEGDDVTESEGDDVTKAEAAGIEEEVEDEADEKDRGDERATDADDGQIDTAAASDNQLTQETSEDTEKEKKENVVTETKEEGAENLDEKTTEEVGEKVDQETIEESEVESKEEKEKNDAEKDETTVTETDTDQGEISSTEDKKTDEEAQADVEQKDDTETDKEKEEQRDEAETDKEKEEQRDDTETDKEKEEQRDEADTDKEKLKERDETETETVKEKESEEQKDEDEAGTTNTAQESQSVQTTGGSKEESASDSRSKEVSFAEGTIYRETTQMSLLSRSQSQATAFDEDALNESQFVQVTETFLGVTVHPVAFQKLVVFIREGYVETEEERRQRMYKAAMEVRRLQRKQLSDELFDVWDNDGSGYLDFTEVDPLIMLYKGGMEEEPLKKAKRKVAAQQRNPDGRMTKKEFRFFLTAISDLIPGDDSFEYLVQFLLQTIERTYQERVRGEARKKWLNAIKNSAVTSAANMEPVFRAVFQALFKDAETHGGGKRINAFISLIECNDVTPSRGPIMLRYVASTPTDSEFLIGQALFPDMKGISFAAVESGKPIHVPKVQSHGNLHFWNPAHNETRDGSFIVVPLKDRSGRVFGILGLDTIGASETKNVFITHEIQFYQGVSKAFSIAYHHVDVRHKTMLVAESAVAWLHRRCFHCSEITFYMVEPEKVGKKNSDFVLRKMLVTDEKGMPKTFLDPPRMERKDNLFRDYLFKCVDTSESVSADAYGERHLTVPVRDKDGLAVSVLDMGIGTLKKLPPGENKEMTKMLKLLQTAYLEIVRQAEEGSALDSEDVAVMFDKLMLQDLKENVRRLDARAYAEMKSYYDPPKIIHLIIKAVLSIFYPDKALQGLFNDWGPCKQIIGVDLGFKIMDFDPTTAVSIVPPTDILAILDDVPHGDVSRQGSKPAQHLYNWVFVCLSLLEHTRKMKAMRGDVGSAQTSPRSPTKDESAQDQTNPDNPDLQNADTSAQEQTTQNESASDAPAQEPQSEQPEEEMASESQVVDADVAVNDAIDVIEDVAPQVE